MKKHHVIFFFVLGIFLLPLTASAGKVSCPKGTSQVGSVCMINCPSGWGTKGSVCIKPKSHVYFSGAFAWTKKNACKRGGYTCKKRGLLKKWYRNCKSGFKVHKVRTFQYYCHRACTKLFAGSVGYGACKRRIIKPRCKPGTSNYKGRCLRNCPRGWATQGAYCKKPKSHVYFSGAFAWTHKKACQRGGYTCKKRGLLKKWYRNCKSGFKVHKVRTFKYYCHRACSSDFAGGKGYTHCKRK